jgi:GAF domain-containing protein
VRIKWDDNEYQSLDFSTVRSKQSEPIMVSGKRRGELEVGYTMEKPTIWQGPFLKEEAKLLRSIALWLSLVIEKIDSN